MKSNYIPSSLQNNRIVLFRVRNVFSYEATFFISKYSIKYKILKYGGDATNPEFTC